jgi:hypothetical protein
LLLLVNNFTKAVAQLPPPITATLVEFKLIYAGLKLKKGTCCGFNQTGKISYNL